jgi:Cation transporter/ATPase, N-terminus
MAFSATSIQPRNIRPAVRHDDGIQVSERLTRSASFPADDVVRELDSRLEGLAEAEAQQRLETFGPNVVARDERFTRLRMLIHRA